MSLGNPEFLHPYWDKLNVTAFLDLTKNLNYKYGSLNCLKHNIKLLHEKIGNANPKDHYVVIGNGVTQLVNGLVHLNSSPLLFAEPPHYHRFFEFAHLNNKQWIDHENALNIATVPSNPEGIYKDALNHKADTIFDMNYHWPQYVLNLTSLPDFNFDIMVFGASKALGFSSARIGWALIKDEELAKKLEKYVEFTTGGVSIYSQKIVNRLIKKQLILDETVFDYGRKILENRWKDIWFNIKLPFEIHNSSGMFLWCKGECPKNLKGFPGNYFGVSDDYFRLNIGVSNSTWSKFKELYGAK